MIIALGGKKEVFYLGEINGLSYQLVSLKVAFIWWSDFKEHSLKCLFKSQGITN